MMLIAIAFFPWRQPRDYFEVLVTWTIWLPMFFDKMAAVYFWDAFTKSKFGCRVLFLENLSLKENIPLEKDSVKFTCFWPQIQNCTLSQIQLQFKSCKRKHKNKQLSIDCKKKFKKETQCSVNHFFICLIFLFVFVVAWGMEDGMDDVWQRRGNLKQFRCFDDSTFAWQPELLPLKTAL